jgi:hypothetical protein
MPDEEYGLKLGVKYRESGRTTGMKNVGGLLYRPASTKAFYLP